MRVLVLGGTKFVGPHVVRLLAERGHEVAVFHRGLTEATLPQGVLHVHGEFSAFGGHVDELRRLGPEVVLDMVPFRREDAERVKAFRGVARRAVAISSADVYRAFGRLWRTEPGPPDPVPLTEDSPLRAELTGSGLDYDKTGVERALADAPGMPVTVLRLPATHGPGDTQHRLFEYLKRMDDGRPAILLEEGQADWQWARGYVEDVAHAITLAVTDERAAGRIYNVAYPESYTEAEWVRRIARCVGWDGEVVAAPSSLLPAHLRGGNFDFAQQYSIDSGRIRRELDYAELLPLEEALLRTVGWERANPPADLDLGQFDYDAEDKALKALGFI